MPVVHSEAPVRHVLEARATLHAMESKLANEAKLALLMAARRLTPREQINYPVIAGESLERVLLERLTKRYGRDAVENLNKLLST